MNELQVLENRTILNEEFTIYGTKEEPLFLAKDVAKMIEHSNLTVMLNLVEENEKIKIRPKQSLGLMTTNNEYNFLTEDGLYEILMRSKKPIAKAFKKEVKVILKQIRTTGGYIPVSEEDGEAELMAKAFLIAQRTIERKNKLLAEKELVIEEKTLVIGVMTPKAEAYDEFMDSDGMYTITNVAKLLKVKARILLFPLLRKKGLVCKASATPTSKAIEQGILKSVPQNGYLCTKVTPYGVEKIIGLLKMAS